MDSIEYETIVKYLTLQVYPSDSDKNTKRILRRKASTYAIRSGQLVKPSGDNFQLVVIDKRVHEIFKEVHDNVGHQCFRYSYRIAKERFYWPKMYNEIRSYILKCVPCQKNQPSLKAPILPLQPLPVITKVWYRVGMDLTGSLIESEGYKYVLTFIDHFTKWIETRPLRSKEASQVAKGFFSIYCRQGAPMQIICDNGPEFTSMISKYLQETHNCKLIFSTPYHPETNGLVESAHKAIKRSLIKSIGEKSENWYHYLEQVTFSLNIRPRDTTNYSAFELMHGSRKPRLPSDAENLLFLYPDISIGNTPQSSEDDQNNQFMKTEQENSFEEAVQNLRKSKEIMKTSFDKNINPINKTFRVNDEVLIENLSRKRSKGGKLQNRWVGPYPITRALSAPHLLERAPAPRS